MKHASLTAYLYPKKRWYTKYTVVYKARQSTGCEYRGTNVAIQDSFNAKLEPLQQLINTFEETPTKPANCAGDIILPFNTDIQTET